MICAHKECNNTYIKATHNQRYCSDECCRQATNARLMEQYYAKKARRNGILRICGIDKCSTRLSRYNESPICQRCGAKEKSLEVDTLKILIGLA